MTWVEVESKWREPMSKKGYYLKASFSRGFSPDEKNHASVFLKLKSSRHGFADVKHYHDISTMNDVADDVDKWLASKIQKSISVHKASIGKLRVATNSLEDLERIIKRDLYWAEVHFNPIGKNKWSVSNKNGLVPHYVVILKAGRIRLEEVDDVNKYKDSNIEKSLTAPFLRAVYKELRRLVAKQLSPANERRRLAGLILDKVSKIGIRANGDAYGSNIGIWSDKPINEKTKDMGKYDARFKNTDRPYLTTFTEISARRFLGENG
jgi:hypothetical protein